MNVGGDRKIVFALLGIAVLCLIGLGGSLYHAKSTELQTLTQKLLDKENELTEVKAKVTQLPQLETQYAELQGRLAVLEPALPTSAYIPTFLRQLEHLATGTRNDIIMIRPKPAVKRSAADKAVKINDETGEVLQVKPGEVAAAPPPPELPYDFVPIELKLNGTYWTIINFLDQLQRFPKMIAVNDISFSPNQGGMGSGYSPNLAATMELTAVVMKGVSDGNSA